MLRLIFFLLFIFNINNLSLAQSKILSLNYRFGLPVNIKPIPHGLKKGYQYRKAETLFDQGLVVNYSHRIWKKIGLYGNIGFDVSRTKRYQKFVEYDNRRHIDNIILNDNRFDVHFGLEKKISLFDSKLILNFGWRLVVRNSFEKSINYSSDFETFSYGNGATIQYRYDLTTHHGKFYKNSAGINQTGKIGNDFFTGFNIRINDNILFNFSLNLTTHNIFYYDYKYEMLYYWEDVKVKDIEHHGLSLSEHKYGVKDNLFYLSTGVSFKLGKQ